MRAPFGDDDAEMRLLCGEVLFVKQLKIGAIVRHHRALLLNSKRKLRLIGQVQTPGIAHGQHVEAA